MYSSIQILFLTQPLRHAERCAVGTLGIIFYDLCDVPGIQWVRLHRLHIIIQRTQVQPIQKFILVSFFSTILAITAFLFGLDGLCIRLPQPGKVIIAQRFPLSSFFCISSAIAYASESWALSKPVWMNA